MKTHKTSTLAILMVLVVFIINSCNLCNLCKIKIRYNEGDFEKSWQDKDTSNINKERLIVSYNDISQIDNDPIFNSANVIDSCACGSLLLIGPKDNTIIMEGLLPARPSDPEVEGATFFDIEVQLNIIPDKSGKIDSVYNPKQRDVKGYTFGTSQLKDTITIALIDGGIPNAEMLDINLWTNKKELLGNRGKDDDHNCYTDDIHGYDFALDTNLYVSEANMHGNYISQIISNTVPAGIPYEIMDLKVFDKEGKGSLFDAICAIDYAIKNGADIINLSWGYYRGIEDNEGLRSDSLLLHYIKKANDANIPIFASAGNRSINTDTVKYHFPSGFFSILDSIEAPKNLISVAALNLEEDSLVDFSNSGKKSVALSAKGIHQVMHLGYGEDNAIAGTSFASPFALCHAIEILTNSRIITPADLKRCLLERSTYMGLPISSEGKINIYDTRPCE